MAKSLDIIRIADGLASAKQKRQREQMLLKKATKKVEVVLPVEEQRHQVVKKVKKRFEVRGESLGQAVSEETAKALRMIAEKSLLTQAKQKAKDQRRAVVRVEPTAEQRAYFARLRTELVGTLSV